MPLLEQVFEQNKDTVRIVFKNMPLRFHKMAEPAARAALAAGEQGKFWEFHDDLFAAEKLTEEVITATAVKLGLDMEKFARDLNSPAIKQQIKQDLRDAQKAGVTGTPTIFINGKKLKNRSMQGFQTMIADELKKPNQS
ncbi:MAG: thioredoxin domain-containing protein [Desulfobacterales bacterium]|nr:DsbA family protein [Deltaproteobacteria bacterium]NNK94378.1 thioredoxin domain-containing protein [Desulfobacterales bacterium]